MSVLARARARVRADPNPNPNPNLAPKSTVVGLSVGLLHAPHNMGDEAAGAVGSLP